MLLYHKFNLYYCITIPLVLHSSYRSIVNNTTLDIQSLHINLNFKNIHV